MCSEAPSTAATSGSMSRGHGEVDQDRAGRAARRGRDAAAPARRSRRRRRRPRRSPPRRSAKSTARPPNRDASAAARSGSRLATAIDATPRADRLAATSSATRPAPTTSTRAVASSVPQRSRGELGGDGGRRGAALADRRLVAHALPGLERLVEEPVGDRAGRVPLVRRLVGLADLGEDLRLAGHHRVEAAGDAEQVARRRLAAVDVEHRLEPLGGVAREMAEAARPPPPASHPHRRRPCRARTGCRSRGRRPRRRRRRPSGARRSSRPWSCAASRSRTASGARVWFVPTRTSSGRR